MINHHNCKRSLHKGKASFFKLVGGETKNKKKEVFFDRYEIRRWI